MYFKLIGGLLGAIVLATLACYHISEPDDLLVSFGLIELASAIFLLIYTINTTINNKWKI